MSVQLRPMRDEEFVAWLPRMRDGYAQDMIRNADLPAERARAKAAEDTERSFPGERPSVDQAVYVIEADGERVGDLWVAERDDALQRCLFVYLVHVDERFRGRGYGRAAMVFAEDEARRRGFDRIALNVFGGNAVARDLCLSLGYEENAVAMSKAV
jgi:GNAT superfamily N-acetyltransferase